ncbi:hypothetical protein BKA66DRAFT_442782 [Pyrenochaeta sp. MPI-SDFR-AT-0127]|nr:hypothetical protein BKA66DRAFT_442782 [Pyrenochaeta sp. MPI-SDFR-AT-0127]
MDMLNRKYLGQADQMQLHTGLPSIMDPLEKITKMQAELNENREQLLIQREAVRASARKVHNQRQRTGDAEACLMNAMREYLNQSGIELPSSITNAYAQLDTARNILGSHEDDYLTLERQLAGTEWSYMEMENDFYQFDLADLLSSDICPEECLFTDTEAIPNLDRSVSSIQSSNPSIASRDLRLVNQELHTLKEKFNALRQEQSELLEFEDFDHVAFDEVEVEHARSGASRIEAESFDILDRIFNLEVESQRLKLEEMDRKLQLPVCRHVISEPSRVTQHSSSIDRAVTESAVSLLSPSHSMKHTLQAWILDRLKQDVVQKTMYLNVLQDFEIPPALSESWEERATRYWSVDSSSDISEEENRTTNPPLSTRSHSG